MRVFSIFALLLNLSLANALTAQAVHGSGLSAQVAIASGKITAEFVGTGGSSGDSIKVRLAKTPKAGPGPLEIDIPPGSALWSSDSDAQNMMVVGVRGVDSGAGTFRPTSKIILTSTRPVTYVLSAFCLQFTRKNPSEATTFSLSTEESDPTLACIAKRGRTVSTATAQAAVWTYTDSLTFDHMNQKFTVNAQEWATAQGLVTACGGISSTAANTPASGPSLAETLKWLAEKLASSGQQQQIGEPPNSLMRSYTYDDIHYQGCTIFVTAHEETNMFDGRFWNGIDDIITISLGDVNPSTAYSNNGLFLTVINGPIGIIKETKRLGIGKDSFSQVSRSRWNIVFSDLNTANRVLMAFKHANELCKSGSNKEPF